MGNDTGAQVAYGTFSELVSKNIQQRKMERRIQDGMQIPSIEVQYAFIIADKSLLMTKPTKISSLIFCS